ncbi:MAG TPA: glutaredoxin domain-containing protein [Pseudomonadota bacterium]|mgnify:FL=1|jgi:monothiol glutaredoxin|nr:glutaredoxin domain-containing protein [Pseudomonadota bacterium]HRA38445.1 glutaredoxin domain-containing protein [Pseudomonadota bacterium]
MSLDPALRERIAGILASHRVVLFMKGTRAAPRCGFSAGAVGTLDGLLEAYHDIDVLADADLREGIKAYGNWPTIPQLYIGGELVGGSDIIQQLAGSGELHALLGVAAPDRTPPAITITAPAADAIRAALADAGDDRLHVAIDGRFRTQFLLKPAAGDEIRAESAGIEVLFDLASAQRARGLVIDWAETVQGAGLVIRNPNAPAAVKDLGVRELQAELAAGRITVVDVRPAEDRALAPFPAARVLEPSTMAALEALPKDTPLAFLCHHGNSSRAAAEHFRGLGFRNLCNIEGGIDAWSREVDASVPRY